MAETEEREESVRKVREKLEFLLSRDNLQEDCFIQMNMDSQMQIPIPILAGHQQFEEMGHVADIATLFDAALSSEHVIVDKESMQIKPILKSKRNTVILHDLPEAIPQEASVDFAAGDRVHVWSSSAKRWFDDGEVQAIAPDGAVHVRFNNARPASKEVPGRQAHKVLRKFGSGSARRTDPRAVLRQAIGTGLGPRDAKRRCEEVFAQCAQGRRGISQADLSQFLRSLGHEARASLLSALFARAEKNAGAMELDSFTSWVYSGHGLQASSAQEPLHGEEPPRAMSKPGFQALRPSKRQAAEPSGACAPQKRSKTDEVQGVLAKPQLSGNVGNQKEVCQAAAKDCKQIFDGCALLLCSRGGAMSSTRRQLLQDRICEAGGNLRESWDETVTHVVVAGQLPRAMLMRDYPDAKNGSGFKAVVTDAWVCESLALGRRLPEVRYAWCPVAEGDGTEPPQRKEGASTQLSIKKEPQQVSNKLDTLAECVGEPGWGVFASPDDLRAKIVEEFRTCAAAWAVRGDKWRSWQYKKAEQLVAQLRGALQREELRNSGLTPKFVQKCQEIQEKGCLQQADGFRKDADVHALLEMTRIHGVGPALAQTWLRCGVRSIADVRQRVDSLPGNAGGPATGLTKAQRLGLRFVDDFQVPISRSEVERVHCAVLRAAEAAGCVASVVPCGAYRRGDVFCSGMTLVVCLDGEGAVESDTAAYLLAMESGGVIVADLSSNAPQSAKAVRVPGDDDPTGSAQACLCVVRGCPIEGEPMRYRRCDFVFCRRAALPFITLQWTGSDGGLFNREMKRIAALRGLHLSHTYMCKADREGARGRQVGEICRAGAKIDCADERAIFAAIGISYRPPERRDAWLVFSSMSKACYNQQ
ncbi:Poll [Symbiodinium natans]|uniref:Poll protein n=1 Tax=Symbiodinium natans TaxID=878477 RepID=A0A812I9C9_9DINO|nr:Poll [Symbiodinium natans]